MRLAEGSSFRAWRSGWDRLVRFAGAHEKVALRLPEVGIGGPRCDEAIEVGECGFKGARASLEEAG